MINPFIYLVMVGVGLLLVGAELSFNIGGPVLGSIGTLLAIAGSILYLYNGIRIRNPFFYMGVGLLFAMIGLSDKSGGSFWLAPGAILTIVGLILFLSNKKQ